ncbi:MAG: hypothetical protein COA78_22110 [Blastopirellula sp.]|nr:MAG: hypothetical protein COA78_22110 [Blastopirellula sp.]
MEKFTMIAVLAWSFLYRALIFCSFMYAVFFLGHSAWFLVLMSLLISFAPSFSVSSNPTKEDKQ